MRNPRLLKWAILASLGGGMLFQTASCGTMARQAIIQGSFSWVTGAVGSSLTDTGVFFSDMLLGLLTNPSNGA